MQLTETNVDYSPHRALQIYTGYRLAVSGFLWTLFQLKAGDIFLGQSLPNLFNWCALVYFFSSLGFYFFNTKNVQHTRVSAEIQVFLDIGFITLLMHASGGISTGMGMLLAVSVTTVCLLTGRSSSLVFAAIASAAVLGQTIYSNLSGQSTDDQITQAGLLGATFFATSLFALLTSKRLRQSEQEAARTSRSLESMEKLNERIIQFMKTGVLVVDSQRKIQFINTAAWKLLEMPQRVNNQLLKYASRDLDKIVNKWEQTKVANASFRQSPTGPLLQVKLSTIYKDNERLIIFIEDTTQMVQQAQNLKLASLGRLTASIAHEIRNPLGALSHAAQLLDESSELSTADKKLVDMVQKNSVRVNTIIENIMQLSQRKTPEVQKVLLKPFITNLTQELQPNYPKRLDISINIEPPDLEVSFDITQLMQVINNLMDNGLRYSIANIDRAILSIASGLNMNTKQYFVDIIDKGEGVDPDVVEHIFEPFYTTSTNGTGLGLYISKELCEANHAQLDYVPVPSGGSCFRITFNRE